MRTPASDVTTYGHLMLSDRPDQDAYVLFEDGEALMHGSTEDLARTRRLAGGTGALLWFRRGGKSYVVRDPGTLQRIRALYAPVSQLGQAQGALGERQGRLGEQQAALGTQMAAMAARDAAAAVAQARASLARARQRCGAACYISDAAGQSCQPAQHAAADRGVGDATASARRAAGRSGNATGRGKRACRRPSAASHA
ncbi:hypothetical protein LN475_11975 [Xanthomonas vesicatoria]|uniref:Uncharacterized protein n=1 Tax=Xanthomonas vesicatoria ATCC 35937 TaxID=925775 RepID=F0BJD0_9XANT|nr:hypothetical protein [Xanthomonas vesicatoria]EGD07409.1 hypothetical protein XVE_4390 [Xanthomonas vesicatoria ATCC 35937]MCC8597373.1 hypothetical protein [Xanthomonas vesicatoria]MCC8607326.1 hypothetical protein [Xanthomonas vesicatoria]MCC8626514.1 hypothetical protein [Xanthomonas vesicatoria]MDG4483311.1 hypothetical protein [Xanthomonas vesicatoria]